MSDPKWCNMIVNPPDTQGPTTTNDDENSNDYSDEDSNEDDEEQGNYLDEENFGSFVPNSLPSMSAMLAQVTASTIVL